MNIMKTSVALSLGLLVTPTFATGVDPVVTDSNFNTAMGTYVLQSGLNQSNSATYSTGAGYFSLQAATGTMNTAFGFYDLWQSSGSYNSAFGAEALNKNATGTDETAVGYRALWVSPNGLQNTAIGSQAMLNNEDGYSNTAVGAYALSEGAHPAGNTAVGRNALYQVIGIENIGLGNFAGSALVSGNSNIDIGNLGVSSDNGAIRIGAAGSQHSTYIQGIYGVSVGSNYGAVVVNSAGQLGMINSSERFKTDIKPLFSDAAKMAQLRPVTFRLKSDPKGPLQYGLIAEEVNKIYPDLVVRNEHGRIDGIRYEQLTPILIKQIQEQRTKLEKLEQQVAAIQTALLDSQGAAARVASR